ncbi:jupiter microtubule associated homolog 1-like [Argiope bruennichi]|uniref:jupiter microtubule associated homolog 1-like n=1 Tax=Argiope bruennichi TaxID=94029 RepID=UPI002494F38C|nr:jupiter microtubule associated homolog 1-like [Argiope bruennichi]
MTSTEFTIGLDGSRNSSKVLKPPGGGSSDIFGLGAAQYSSNERQKNKEAASGNTQNRLFGSSENGTSTPAKKHNTSNIFASEPPQPAKSFKKPYVRRNPITGEEYEMYPENEKKENGEKEKNDDEQENNVEQNGGTTEEEKKTEAPPAKPITTSIRVRNPPGGKSSGIF